MILIFTSIFLTGSLTFCNSLIINRLMDTHFVILSGINFDYYAGLWVDVLPSEIVQQRTTICQLLTKPIIMKDTRTIPLGPDTMYWNFEINYDIPALDLSTLNQLNEYEILVEKNNHLLHLLPCLRANGVQTVYITKLMQYKSLIMLGNNWPICNIKQFKILGFITEFVNIELIESNAVELFINAFGNLIQYEKEEKTNKNFLKILNPEFKDLNLEYRIVLWRLCASVIRKSLIGVEIISRVYIAVAYVHTDFSSIFNVSSKNKKSQISSLHLKVIRCIFPVYSDGNVDLTYYLIKHSSNELFVIYDINNKKTIELFNVSDEEATTLIDFAFAHIDNEI